MGRRAFNFDWVIFITVILLVSLGLVTLLSIEPNSFYQQLVFALLGFGLFLIFSRIDFRWYRYLDTYIYAGVILVLLLTYLGPDVRGATRWLAIGSFRLQPSELVKPFFILAISGFLTRIPPINWKRILFHGAIYILPFLLIFKQPDLGNSLIFTSVWLGLIIISGIPARFLVLGVFVLGAFIPLSLNLLHGYQRQRLETFLSPTLDPRGTGYNALQSMIAVGSGEIFGRGFGRGTQSLLKFLPERHTDFIFATLTEEFGLAGGVLLLALFLILLWRLIKTAHIRQEGMLPHLYLMGLFIQLFTHVIINIGMNMGLVPITGITLPFVSYGGSSLISMFIGMGVATAAMQKSKIQ